MAILATTLDCTHAGFVKLTLCFSALRSSTADDQFKMRIVRTNPDATTTILPQTPQFILTAQEDIRSYTFMDPVIPATGTYVYTLQIYRMNGGGTFNEMNLVAEHFKK